MANDNKPANLPQQSQRNDERIGFAVEVVGCNWTWPINQQVLRGKWDMASIPQGMMPDGQSPFSRMPNIPGLVIEVDSVRKFARIYDPLGLPANKALLERIQKAFFDTWGTNNGPSEEQRFENLSPDELKNWCWNARRLMDSGKGNVVRGKVPDIDSIRKMEGVVQFGTFDSAARLDETNPLLMKQQQIPRNYRAPRVSTPPAREAELLEATF